MRLFALAAGFAAVGTAAAADACLDRVVTLVTDVAVTEPVQGRLVTETAGQPTVVNEFLMVSDTHSLFRPVDPPDLSWTLTRDGVTWQSSDGGESWSEVRRFDVAEERAATQKNLRMQADSAREAVCGEEELNGVRYETVSAEMDFPPPAPFVIAAKYWVEPDTGFVVRSVTRITGQNYDSTVTQDWVRAPGLTLPVPGG